MKKYNIIIMSILSAIFLISGISSVNALTIYDQENDTSITLPDLPSPPNSNFTKYAIAKEKINVGGHYVLFYVYNDRNCYFNENVFSNPNLNYYSFGCNSSTSTNQMRYYYMQNNSWVLQGYTNTYGSLLGNPFATSFDIYTDNTYSDIGYNASYGFYQPIFQVDYENGEVIMSQYNNASANLFSFYFNLFDENNSYDNYIYTYYDYSKDKTYTFRPDYWENGVLYNGVRYYYYFNIPLFYNTDLDLVIYDLENNIVFNNTYSAYLSLLPDNYSVYNINPYKFINISGVNSGTFGVSLPVANDINIYLVNSLDNNRITFEDSSYYVSTYDSNNVRYYEFNLNGNSNLYFVIYIEGDWFNSLNDYYLYAPVGSYVHLSDIPNDKTQQEQIVNQQCYKNLTNEIVCVDNNIVYNGEDIQYLKDSFQFVDNSLDYVVGASSIFAYFIYNLNTPIRMTLVSCFFLSMIGVIVMLFKH